MLKPEYVYQPRRLLARLKSGGNRHSAVAETAFGFPLDIMPDELISNSIRRKGMYDIVTAETIYRLLDPGAKAIDAGAHVGLMSVTMALKVGAAGSVQSFEPHPAVYPVLSRNAVRFNAAIGAEVIRTCPFALSDVSSAVPLFLPDDWNRNTGVARLGSGTGTPVTVESKTLDEVAIPDPVLMKIDVEGHELAVLSGGSKILARLRDIVFEDFAVYPSPVMALLEQQGFQIFALSRTLSRPLLAPADRRGVPERADPNYLATRNPNRARERFQPGGWNVLRKLFLAQFSP